MQRRSEVAAGGPSRSRTPLLRGSGIAVVVSLVLLSFASAIPASALTIRQDQGGSVNAYLSRWRSVAERGEQVMIDGVCASACTLVLSFISPERLCVTPRARFVFHAAWTCGAGNCRDAQDAPAVDRETTARMLASYPPGVRQWLLDRGGLTRELLQLGGDDLAAIVPRCRPTHWPASASQPRPAQSATSDIDHGEPSASVGAPE